MVLPSQTLNRSPWKTNQINGESGSSFSRFRALLHIRPPTMKWMRNVLMLLAAWAAWTALHAQNAHPWEVVEITFEARREYANCYVAGLPDRSAPLAQATFTGTSGAARELRYTLAMFWDGGNTWKARFAPPAAGEWTWSTASQDPGLDAATGKIQAPTCDTGAG